MLKGAAVSWVSIATFAAALQVGFSVDVETGIVIQKQGEMSLVNKVPMVVQVMHYYEEALVLAYDSYT